MAPIVIAWSGFRVKRSGGLTMTEFAAGAVVAVLFFWDAADPVRRRRPRAAGRRRRHGPTYLPIMFMALIALLWGARGATLAAFAATLIALFNTAEGHGPFASVEGFLGDPSSRCRATRRRSR